MSRNYFLLRNVQNNQPFLFFVWTQRAQRVVFKVLCGFCRKAVSSAGHRTSVRSHGHSSKGNQVTLALSFEMAFFWHENVRWHFILFMMATLQPRTIILENPPADWSSSQPTVWMQPFKYLGDSFPPTHPHRRSALPVLDLRYSFFFF